MIYASTFSGIASDAVAWDPLGWRCAFFAEIEPFPSAVLAHRWPDVENLGDATRIERDGGPRAPDGVDLLVGGTPCQSFSVAGLRKGLDDPRGNLALEYLALADRLRPRWVVWENVPGVLSSSEGRDFGAFVGALGQLGYHAAWRVLDAQYFNLAQRRRRVFVVGYLGDWRRAAAVLLEPESLSGHPAPCRETGADVASGVAQGSQGGSGGGGRDDDMSPVLALLADGVGTCGADDNQAQAGHLVAYALSAHDSGSGSRFDPNQQTLILDQANTREVDKPGALMGVAGTKGNKGIAVAVRDPKRPSRLRVRRLTPRESERLQGFPDDYTLVPYRGKPAADSPRYRALGNAMAVPVLRWIGKRIRMVDEIVA